MTFFVGQEHTYAKARKLQENEAAEIGTSLAGLAHFESCPCHAGPMAKLPLTLSCRLQPQHLGTHRCLPQNRTMKPARWVPEEREAASVSAAQRLTLSSAAGFPNQWVPVKNFARRWGSR